MRNVDWGEGWCGNNFLDFRINFLNGKFGTFFGAAFPFINVDTIATQRQAQLVRISIATEPTKAAPPITVIQRKLT